MDISYVELRTFTINCRGMIDSEYDLYYDIV